MRKLVTEFIGTFFLVLTIGLAVTRATPDVAPLAIGIVLMVMVYMGGHVSGAHYNPAVSLALLIRGRLASRDFIPYVLAQTAGSLAAALMVLAVTGQTVAPQPDASAAATTGSAPLFANSAPLIIEMLYTFALSLVVLNVATSRHTQGNSYYGLAIGLTIAAAAAAGGGISGGAFNPAVGTGLTAVNALMGNGTWQHLWLYLVGPFTGGALAAFVFKIQEA